jgi:phospholipid-transporting ATPase
VPLQNLQVGQLVRILRDELVPADLVLLQSSEDDGLCYLETASIDGESNLKLRQAHSRTQNNSNNAKWIDALITCDAPNCEIYHFQGSLQEPLANTNNNALALSNNNFLPRGAVLVNTDWILGVVVYTGRDTKIMQNIRPAQRKRTKMDQLNDEQTGHIVLLLFLLVIILFLGHVFYKYHILSGKHDYLRLDKVHRNFLQMLWSNFAIFVTFLLLLNNLVPISLSVTLEIVRSLLAHLIDNDLDMYDEELQIASKARTSNVLDELGRIQYIMTDKTGTLTSNQMTLKHIYSGNRIHLNCLNDSNGNGNSNNNDNNSDNTIIGVDKQFIQAMALCHTVLIDKRNGTLQASSPDELALLAAAKKLNCTLVAQSSDSMQLKNRSGTSTFTLLALIEFTSDRKRMSRIVRQDDTDRIFIVCKGADSALAPLCTDLDEKALEAVEQFALEGLRTLCFASRDISLNEFTHWHDKWTKAQNHFGPDRSFLIDAAASDIESNLHFIGVSGIEDRLQVGVPKAVSTLLRANIKIWILTGDRAETATNTAYLSGLLKPLHRLVKISTDNLSCPLFDIDTANGAPFVLVMEGAIFTQIFKDPWLIKTFIPVALQARALVACRLSPLQKTQITQFVQQELGKTTLAIGDGGNDVGMIQAAHVGVGINGLEGSQAARSADFSISKFRFLVKLILIHGAWSFHRISRVILYTMYKNFVIVLCQFWYAQLNSFSAQSAFSSFLLLLYNSIFTLAPPILIGITDQYVTAPELLKHPQLYQFGQHGKFVILHQNTSTNVSYFSCSIIVKPFGSAS